MPTRNVRRIVAFVVTAFLLPVLWACGSASDCPTPVIGELRCIPTSVAPDGVALLYIDDISAVVPVSYTWNASQGSIINGRGTSAIQYQAPATPGVYGVTVKVSACDFHREMSIPVIVSGSTVSTVIITPSLSTGVTGTQAAALPCRAMLTASLSPYGPQECSPKGAQGRMQYCQEPYGGFVAAIDLHALHPHRSYVLSLQAADENPQTTDNLLWLSCGERTDRGDAYCDITLPPTNSRGDVSHTLFVSLLPGEYRFKLLLKDADAPDGCVAMYNDKPRPFEVVPSQPFQRGMSYVTWQGGAFSSTPADESLEALAATGSNWIALIVTGYQDNVSATAIHHDSAKTPTDEDLIHVISKARQLGLNVMLKPHVDLLDDSNHWRGQIGIGFSESDWQEWFRSYQDFIYHYATLAAQNEVGVLCVGTELKTASSHDADWRQILEGVRERFDGDLVYASNWDEAGHSWWTELDYLGVDAYFPLKTDSDTPNVEDLKAAWVPHVATLQSLHQEYKRPLILTEIGYRSVQGAHVNPAEWQQDAPASEDEQANLYEAALETFCGQEWLAGIYWWNWLVDPNQGDLGDTDYTPQNKPAEEVLKRYYRDGKCVTSLAPSIPPQPLVGFSGSNGCPVRGASGEVRYLFPFAGYFRATVRIDGLDSNHPYLFTINCREETNACALLAQVCSESQGLGYCDIPLGTTDAAGTLESDIEQPLLAGEYAVKFFVKDPASNWCIPLHNARPESFTVE